MLIPRNFTREELECKQTGELLFETGFLEELQALRSGYGSPMVVTSGCRSPDYNKLIEGHPRSLHMFGNLFHEIDAIAIDISRKGVDLPKLMRLGLSIGWSFGIGDTFIHMDLRTEYLNLPQKVFTYY